MHCGKVVEESGQNESERVVLAHVIDQEGLYCGLQGVLVVHVSNHCAVVLQSSKSFGQPIPCLNCLKGVLQDLAESVFLPILELNN